MKSTFPKIPAWVWIVAAIFALSLIVGQFRSCMKQATKEAVQKVLLREYGDAVRNYRSETEEGIEIVRKMSQTLP